LKNPSRIDVKAFPWKFEISDDGDGYSTSEISTLMSQLFMSDDALKDYMGFTVGVVSALETGASSVVVESVKNGEKTFFELLPDYTINDTGKVTINKGTKITVKKKSALKGLKPGALISGNISPEAKKLKAYCKNVSKVPITLNFKKFNEELLFDGTYNNFKTKMGDISYHVGVLKRGKPLYKLYKNGVNYGSKDVRVTNLDYLKIGIDNPNFNLNLSRSEILFDSNVHQTNENLTKVIDLAYRNLYDELSEEDIKKYKTGAEHNKIRDYIAGKLHFFSNHASEFNLHDENITALFSIPVMKGINKPYVSIQEIFDSFDKTGHVYVATNFRSRTDSDDDLIIECLPTPDGRIQKSMVELISKILNYKSTRSFSIEEPDYIESTAVQFIGGVKKSFKRLSSLEIMVDDFKQYYANFKEKKDSTFKTIAYYTGNALALGLVGSIVLGMGASKYLIKEPLKLTGKAIGYAGRKTGRRLKHVGNGLLDVGSTGLGYAGSAFKILGYGIGVCAVGVAGVAGLVLSGAVVPFAWAGKKVFGSKLYEKTTNKIKSGAYFVFKRPFKVIKEKKQKRESDFQSERYSDEKRLTTLVKNILEENQHLLKTLNLIGQFSVDISSYKELNALLPENVHPSGNVFNLTSERFGSLIRAKLISKYRELQDHSNVNVYLNRNKKKVKEWISFLKTNEEHSTLLKTPILVELAKNMNYYNIQWGFWQPDIYVTVPLQNNYHSHYSDSYINKLKQKVPFDNNISISDSIIKTQNTLMNNCQIESQRYLLDAYTFGDYDAFVNDYDKLNVNDREVILKKIIFDSETENKKIDLYIQKKDFNLIDKIGRLNIRGEKVVS